MNHNRAVRIAAGLSAVITSILLSPPALAADGEAAFKARCGNCHGPRDIQYWGRQRADAAKREAWLTQFLGRHYPPPAAERGPIVAYIQSVIAGGAAK